MLQTRLSSYLTVCFSTPVFRIDIEDNDAGNKAVENYLLNARLRAKAEGEKVWTSRHDLHTVNDESAVVAVRHHFTNAITHLTSQEFDTEIPGEHFRVYMNMWGVISRQGSFRSMMNNSPFDWTGFYFAKAPGAIVELADPRANPNMAAGGKYASNPRKLIVEAKTGTLLVFPGWLNHTLIQEEGEDVQITLEMATTVTVLEED